MKYGVEIQPGLLERSMDKKIYISDILSHTYQGKSTGHYFAVARNYQEMFGDRVIVAGGPVYKTGFNERELLCLPYNAGGGGIKGRLKTFANALKLFKEAKGHIIVLQQCTTITTFLCLALFYRRKSKVYMIQYNREGFRSIIGNFIFNVVKRKIDGIICPNEMVGDAFQGVPYCVVPDYIYVGSDNIEEMSSYKDRKNDVVIVGRISPEKGVVDIARRFSNTKYSILIAGKPQNQEIANELESICKESANIELHLGIIPDEDYVKYIKSGKFSILNYSEEYSERSSGAVFDMLFNGVPVIGKRCKTLQFIEDEGLGIVLDDINKESIDNIMNERYYEAFLSNIIKFKNGQKKHVEGLLFFFSH